MGVFGSATARGKHGAAPEAEAAEREDQDVDVGHPDPAWHEHHTKMAEHHREKAAHHSAIASAHTDHATYHEGAADYHESKAGEYADRSGPGESEPS